MGLYSRLGLYNLQAKLMCELQPGVVLEQRDSFKPNYILMNVVIYANTY